MGNVNVPEEAKALGADVISAALPDLGNANAWNLASAVLAKAAPLIAAAERDRIRRLADEVEALYMRQTASAPDFGVTEIETPFADLIGES